MAIEDHYNQTITINRLTLVEGSTTKKEYTEHLASVKCNIQPLDPKITQDIEGGFGKDKLMFCAVQDIVEGDQIVYGGDTYRVMGIEKYDNFLKRSRHMEVILRIFKS